MTKRYLALVGGLVCLSTALAVAQRPALETRPPKQDYNSGEYLYRAFCASCHGGRGSGDGSVAGILRVPPANLTQIARQAGGTFPRDRVFAAIDGRQAIRGHGLGEMPVWGECSRRLKVRARPSFGSASTRSSVTSSPFKRRRERGAT